jgi:hypothetical protein
MTIRTDVTIDWSSSPRIIEVAAPSTEISIQDLHDTCKYFEDNVEGVLHPYLIDSAGKEFLGGTLYVGITATLNNALIKFEDRGGPSWVLCIISGGNLVAIDDVGADMDPREPSAYVSADRASAVSAALLDAGAGITVEEIGDEIDSRLLPYLKRTIGLTQENYFLDQTQYTEYQGQQLMTSGRIRIYNSPVHVGTGTGILSTYLITSTWTDDQLDDYKVVRQSTTTTT